MAHEETLKETHEVIKAHGLASLTAIWKGLRYISRRARSLTSPTIMTINGREDESEVINVLLMENL